MELPIDYNNSPWQIRKKAREQYIKNQDGLCWYCKEPLTKDPALKVIRSHINLSLFPKGMFKYPIHLHHNHVTGESIGAVHARCNAYLWQYEGE